MTNFPVAKSIYIWQLSLKTIEWLAKPRLFDNIWNFIRNRYSSEISLIIHKKSNKCHNSKTITNYKILIALCSTAIKSSTKKKRVNNFFSNFSRKVFFFTLFCFFLQILFVLRSPSDSTALMIWLRLHIIKYITKWNNCLRAEFWNSNYVLVEISLKLWNSLKIALPKKLKVFQNTQYLSQNKWYHCDRMSSLIPLD